MAIEFTIDFEEEDLSDFDSTTGGEDLSATGGSAMVGSFGMNYLMDDLNDHYGSKTLTYSAWTDIRLRFYLDPNTYSADDVTNFACAMVGTDGSYNGIISVVWIRLGYTIAGGYRIQAEFRDDADAENGVGYENIGDVEHYIEILCSRESSDGAGDGVGRLWIDGGEITPAQTALENWNIFPTMDDVDLGQVFGIDANTTGNIFFDDLIFRSDDTEIGSAVGALEINVAPDNIDSYTQGIRIK